MEHTKGNWEVKIDAEFVNKYKAGMKTKRHKIVVGDKLIATIWAEDEFRNMETAKQEEANANAQLISVAPKMLEILQEELEQLEEWNGNGNYTERIDKIKNVITEAGCSKGKKHYA